MNILYLLLPRPTSVLPCEGVLPLKSIRKIAASFDRRADAERLIGWFRFFGFEPGVADSDLAELMFRDDPQLAKDAFRLTVSPNSMLLEASSDSGFFYACGAVTQLLALACSTGSDSPVCDCGVIEDSPAFFWRGFMLDSARHFQSVETVLEVIRFLSAYRINVLHMHLVDDQGWRAGLKSASRMADCESPRKDQYSREDLLRIASYAKMHHIMIVPEIDMPGHSSLLLRHYPELSCDPEHPSRELCLSSPRVREFLTEVLREIVEIFPESTHIHLGGDEADTTGWLHCPSCCAKMNELSVGIRGVEAKFMSDMCGVVRSLGRTPICWSTDTPPPEGAVMQTWRTWMDIVYAHGANHQIINSLAPNYYFDYPANNMEPHPDYMPILDESGVYISSPYHHLNRKNAGSSFLGVEACLWTECVPEWRVIGKTASRIAAFAEVAWTLHEQRDYDNFLSRRKALDASAWTELIRMNRVC